MITTITPVPGIPLNISADAVADAAPPFWHLAAALPLFDLEIVADLPTTLRLTVGRVEIDIRRTAPLAPLAPLSLWEISATVDGQLVAGRSVYGDDFDLIAYAVELYADIDPRSI